MSDAKQTATMSFSDINAFIRSYLSSTGLNDSKSDSGFATIDNFLSQNEDALLHMSLLADSGLGKSGNEEEPKAVNSINVRGTVYKINNSEADCHTTYLIARYLNFNYTEALLVLSQIVSSTDTASLLFSMECVLHERAARLETLSLLTSNESFPVFGSKYYRLFAQTKRVDICRDLQSLLENLITSMLETCPLEELDPSLSNSISRTDYANLALLKNYSNLTYLADLLKLLANLILNTSVPDDIVLHWFTILTKLTDLIRLKLPQLISNIPTRILTHLDSLGTVVSLLMLGFNTTICAVDVDSPYFNDAKVFQEIQRQIESLLPSNSVLLYAWSFILYTKEYQIEVENCGEDTVEVQEEIGSAFSGGNVSLSTLSTLFAQRAESMNVVDNFISLYESLSADTLFSIILTSFLTYQLHFTPITSKVSQAIKVVLSKTPTEFVERFLTSDIFEERLHVLMAKLPLVNEALVPLINICSANIDFADFELKELNTYATKTTLGEIDYDILDAEQMLDTKNGEGMNGVQTPSENKDERMIVSSSAATTATTTTDLIELKSQLLVRPPLEFRDNVRLPIPKSTKGRVLQITKVSELPPFQPKLLNSDTDKENKSMTNMSNSTATTDKTKMMATSDTTTSNILIFLYRYSGWSLLGRGLANLIDLYIQNGTKIEHSYIDILVSLVDLITAVVSPKTPKKTAVEIVESLSSSIDGNEDDKNGIISCIFKLFETAVSKRDYRLSCTCCAFTNALVSNFAPAVWSYLTYTERLDKYNKTSLATSVLGNLELPNGDYNFTVTFTKLVGSLVDEVLVPNSAVSAKTKADTIKNLIRHLLNVYQSYRFWQFNDIYQQFELGVLLTQLFMKVLHNVYVVDPQTPPGEKPSGALAEAASDIADEFLGLHTLESGATANLVRVLTSYINKELYSIGNEAFDPCYVALVSSSYEFATLLILMRGYQNLPSSALEQLIFQSASTFVDIYCASRRLRRPVLGLLHALISVPWNGDNFPFLLSYLGEEHSRAFFRAISADLRNPLDNFELTSDIYCFLSALMTSKQDGLSILFLTGDIASKNKILSSECSKSKTSSETTVNTKEDKVLIKASQQGKSEKAGTGSGVSSLTLLKKKVVGLEKMADYAACSLLDAIANAFNMWHYSHYLRDDEELINALIKIFKDLDISKLTYDTSMSNRELLALSYKYRMISRIVEIFALHLFTNESDKSPVYKLLNEGGSKLFALMKLYFSVDDTALSLIGEVESKFFELGTGYKLSDFRLAPFVNKRTRHDIPFFDLPLMGKLLTNTVGDDTVMAELRLQLEKVSSITLCQEYQTATAKVWGALLTSFIKASKYELDVGYIELVSHFLQANIDVANSGQKFCDICQERIELCFYFLNSFRQTSKKIPQGKLIELLTKLLTLLKSESVQFLRSIATSTQAQIYRPILRSSLVVLDLVSNKKEFVELCSAPLLEFFQWTFSKGVHAILSDILTSLSQSSSIPGKPLVINNLDEKIRDLLLLYSIFEHVNRLNPPDAFKTAIASSLDEAGTIKVLLNLYSTSPYASRDDEPLLGQLTLSFISELCTVKQVSERLITGGLFAVLLESKVSVALQNGGVRPETDPRLQSMWSRGLLLIVMLLLSEFKTKILPECCLFISYFTKQIQTTVYSWSDSKLAISTALIRETSQYILLQRMLASLNYQHYLKSVRVSGNLEGKATGESSLEQSPLIVGLDTLEERRDLSRTLNSLLTHPKYLNSRIVPCTLEEQQALEDEESKSKFFSLINDEIEELQKSLTVQES